MKFRKSIIKTLDLLIAESSKNISDDSKKDKLEAWHIGLDDIKDEQILSGLKKALKSTTGFLTSCGEFRELCISDEEVMSMELQAHRAWNLVYKNLNSYTSPYFKDAAIAETVRIMGGWKKICSMLIKDEPFIKKEFFSIYNPLKKSGKTDYDPYLIGGSGSKSMHFLGFDTKDDNEKKLIEEITKTVISREEDEKKLLDMYHGD